MVALSVTITPPSARARELVDAYADACRSTLWMVGGQAAEGMRASIEARGGVIASPSMQEMRKQVDRAFAEQRRAAREG
jgi:hypothetical protein